MAGKVDNGESLLEAAIRECKEEVGYNVDPNLLIPFCSHYMKDKIVEQNTHLYTYEVTPEEIYKIQTSSTSLKASDARVENSAYAIVHMVNDSFKNIRKSVWSGTGLEEFELLVKSGLIVKPKKYINHL